MTNNSKDFYYFEQFSLAFVFMPAVLLLFGEWLVYVFVMFIEGSLLISIKKLKQFFFHNKGMLRVILLYNSGSITCALLRHFHEVAFSLIFLLIFAVLFSSYSKAQKINYKSMGSE